MMKVNLAKFPRMSSVIPKLLSISPHPPSIKILETKCFKIMQHIVKSNAKSKVHYISLQAYYNYNKCTILLCKFGQIDGITTPCYKRWLSHIM
jgi:hypothetical protein